MATTSSNYLSNGTNSLGCILKLSYNVTSVDYINQTSTISWDVLFTENGYMDISNMYFTGYVSIGGEDKQWSTYVTAPKNTKDKVIASGTHVIQHTNYAARKVDIIFVAVNNYDSDNVTTSYTVPSTAPYATVYKVRNQNGSSTLYDEDDFVLNYRNGAKDQATSMQACISYDGYNVDVGYFDIDKTDSFYTFKLTDLERSNLWMYYSTTTSNKFYFIIKTVFNGETFLSKVQFTIKLKNYEPVLNPTVVDNNSDTLRLTNDEHTLIRYMSDAYYKVGAKAIKGALITEQFCRNDETYYSSEGTIYNVESNTFYFGATDTRGSAINDAVVFNNLQENKWIDYIKLTATIKDVQFNADGNLTITVSGKYFDGYFGQEGVAANNKLTIDYEIHESSGYPTQWNTLGFVTPSVDANNNYTYSFTISGLDYLKSYSVSIKASDELMATGTISKTVISTPVFDWSNDDFKFNVPVTMTDGFTYPQKILWSTPMMMTADETITLNEPISKQSTGIVLIFSSVDESTGATKDASIHSFFIPKVQVQYIFAEPTESGEWQSLSTPHMFMMGLNSNMGAFGSKYIYITDTQLKGFDGNNKSGTAATGIKFDNTRFVLRYVLGV